MLAAADMPALDLPLRLVDDAQALPLVDARAFTEGRSPRDVRAVLSPARGLPIELVAAWTAGRTAGAAFAPWRDGSTGALEGEVEVRRASDVLVAPAFGAVVAGDGRVFRSTVGELLPFRNGLAELPGARREGDAVYLRPLADAPRIGPAAVFQAWGGAFNYGHFLLDCLPALLAVEEAGLLDHAPPVAPPLSQWRRDLLRLGFPRVAVRETRSAWVHAEEAVFSTAMDHYLHRPGPLTARLRARLLAAAPPPDGPPLKLWFSRRALPMRVLVNEAALERSLRARGFTVIRPERLSVSRQIALCRRAEVIAGATGAAMANALFAPEGARVVELLPENYAAPWLRDLCRVLNLDWRGWFAPSPTDPGEAPWLTRVRRGFRFAWRADVDGFLDWL